jgi:hypothetical protein
MVCVAPVHWVGRRNSPLGPLRKKLQVWVTVERDPPRFMSLSFEMRLASLGN